VTSPSQTPHQLPRAWCAVGLPGWLRRGLLARPGLQRSGPGDRGGEMLAIKLLEDLTGTPLRLAATVGARNSW